MREAFLPPQDVSLSQEKDISRMSADILLDHAGTAGRNPFEASEEAVAQVLGQYPEHAKLLWLMNGHAGSILRHLSRDPENQAASCLRGLKTWKEGLLQGALGAPETIPDILKGPSSPDEAYERLAFLDYHPDATDSEGYKQAIFDEARQALGVKSEKWLDLVPAAFPGKTQSRAALHSMLEGVGCIPSELFTKQAFKNLPVTNIADAINALRDMAEQDESEDIRSRARHERARLLNQLFVGGFAQRARQKQQKMVTIDAKGVWVNIPSLKLHEHLPYGLVAQQTLDALEKQQFLDPSQLHEARIREADENCHGAQRALESEKQLTDFAKAYGLDEMEPTRMEARLRDELVSHPAAFGRWLVEREEIVPEALLAGMLRDEVTVASLFPLLQVAEAVDTQVAAEKVSREPDLFSKEKLRSQARASYERRRAILHDPRTYNAVKIIRAILGAGPVQAMSPEDSFLCFRGIEKGGPDEPVHTFFEAVRHGRACRVLVDEGEQLREREREAFRALPALDTMSYETVETALRAFDYFVRTLEEMPKAMAQRKLGWEKKFLEMVHTCLHFVLMNATKLYPAAEQAFSRLQQSPAGSEAWEGCAADLIGTFRSAQDVYRAYLYESQGVGGLLKEYLTPDLTKTDVSFGPEFASQAQKVCAPWGFDEALCLEASAIRVATLRYRSNDPSQTVPFHTELASLEAIRLHRDRPLINVIGGCKSAGQMAEQEEHPLYRMAASIMRVAHDHKANVAIPGTQSGIGAAMGKWATRYEKEHEHLPRAQRAHLFSITPGQNVFYPGKQELIDNQDEIYAIAPTDAILTPFAADWEFRGKDRLRSGYNRHVAYMESLYARLSFEQPRVTVVGNGGYFSLLEVVEAMKNDLSLVLLKGSGRFADAAAAALEHIAPQDLALAPSELDRKLIDVFRRYLPGETAKELLERDFGETDPPQDEDHAVFRSLFRTFLGMALAQKDRVRLASLDTLDGTIQAALA